MVVNKKKKPKKPAAILKKVVDTTIVDTISAEFVIPLLKWVYGKIVNTFFSWVLIAMASTSAALKLFIGEIFPVVKNFTIVNYVTSPWFIGITLSLLILPILYKVVIGLKNNKIETSALSVHQKLNEYIGASGFSPNHNLSETKRNWAECVGKIKATKAKDLRIMGATGYKTFGEKDSPLYTFLEKYDGEVKVLLIEPNANLDALISRAAQTEKTPQNYADEVTKSVERLKDLVRNKNRKITLKLYKQTPIWKMIISNDYMWLQHYSTCSDDVHKTPVYTFYSDGDGGTSLFHALYSVWQKRWELDGNTLVELD